jgi:hypothetical protein
VCQVLLGDEINGVHGCRSNLPITTFTRFMIVLVFTFTTINVAI